MELARILLLLSSSSVFLVHSVPGCIIFSAGKNENSTEALCDELKTNFTIIPQDLPRNIVKLTMNNQIIKSLDSSQFSNLEGLISINLDANGLKTLHRNTFSNLKSLKVLSLQHNQLNLHSESFGSLSLLGLISLESLDLRHNPLGFVPNNHFSSNTLKILHLASTASNFFISPNGFDKMIALEYLDLSYSGLTTLPRELKANFMKMNLKTVLLQGNPWFCDCRIDWLKEWYENLIHQASSSNLDYNDAINKDSPMCHEPEKLNGKYLTGKGAKTLDISDLKCSSEIFTQDTSINVVEGSNVTFICDCYSDPPTKVRWLKDNELIQSHYDQRVTIDQTSGKAFKANLTINSVDLNDEGIWQCIINDFDRQKSTKFSLGVYRANGIKDGSFYEGWMNMNSSLVVKYIGLSIACFVLFIMLISLIVYCFYDRSGKTANSKSKKINEAQGNFQNSNSQNTQYLQSNSLGYQTSFKTDPESQTGFLYDEYAQMPSSIYPGSESIQTSQINENFMTFCPIGDQNFILTSPDSTQENAYGDMLTLRVLPSTTSTASMGAQSNSANNIITTAKNSRNDLSQNFPLQHVTFLPADLVFLNESSTKHNQEACPLHGSLMTTSTNLQHRDKKNRGNVDVKPLSSTAV